MKSEKVKSEKMLKAVWRLNRSARYTLYPEANHNSWDLTYDNDSLYLWFLSKTKFHYREMPVNPVTAKSFVGEYAGTYGDTVLIMFDGNQLKARRGRDTVSLKAAGENLFFLDPDYLMEIRFYKDSFLLMGGHREIYRRL